MLQETIMSKEKLTIDEVLTLAEKVEEFQETKGEFIGFWYEGNIADLKVVIGANFGWDYGNYNNFTLAVMVGDICLAKQQYTGTPKHPLSPSKKGDIRVKRFYETIANNVKKSGSPKARKNKEDRCASALDYARGML
ncbi:hypothetical protein GOV10_05925 [Candidatus Woesearchaeota archaeon]|nr:hypothetical protein [Candidatus Woesearchaeota archaeon]